MQLLAQHQVREGPELLCMLRPMELGLDCRLPWLLPCGWTRRRAPPHA